MSGRATPDDQAVVDGLVAAARAVGDLDGPARIAAQAGLDRLTKPPGSLGRLEAMVVQLAGITGRADAPVTRRTIVVAAADHGVARRGVSAYPPEVTAQMVANFVRGGAAINVLAAAVGASVIVVDAGVASPLPELPPQDSPRIPAAWADPEVPGTRRARLVSAPIRQGTADMTEQAAMTRVQALRAIALGAEVVQHEIAVGLDIVGLGEMGIGNTTAASAITAVMLGLEPALVTGRGTGLDAAGRERKIEVIRAALRRDAPDNADPLAVLTTVGGLEIGVLVGVILAAVAARIPVVLDGFITGSAALIAAGLAPGIADRLLAAHRSVEPGHALLLEHLGLDPLLDLGLRLGEGTGAALAIGLIDAAVRVRDAMATFDSAAISGATDTRA